MFDEVAVERAILGAILLEPQAYFLCSELKADDFTLTSHRTIFSTIGELSASAQSWDIVTLVQKLGPNLARVGDAAYVAGLVDGVPERSHVDEYVRLLLSGSRRRRLASLCTAALRQVEDLSEETEDCISVTLDRILELAGNNKRNRSLKLCDYASSVYERVKKAAAMPLSELPIGLPTGLKGVDRLTTGLRPGELWILASWTGEGKSILATQIIVENVIRSTPVLLFTQEMNRRQVLLRMIPQLTKGHVKGRMLRDPRNMLASHLREFERTEETINTWPLWVNDAASMEIETLFAHTVAMVKQWKVRLVVVDYLQLIKGRGQGRYEKVSDVSSMLRELAKISDIPILAVSQLARPENRDKRQPRIFDLKESGSIEQDAHVIILPYRPQDRDGHYTGEDVIFIGKQREGPTGTIKVRFDSLTLTFQPRDEDDGNYGDEAMF